MDVAAFLGQHPPFESLDPERLASVGRSVRIEFFPAGATILEQGGEPNQFLYVVRSGAVEILDHGILVDLAGPGEVFGVVSVLAGEVPSATVRAHEDTLCYLVEGERAKEVLAGEPGLSVIRVSLHRLAARARTGGETPDDLGRVRVGSLVRRPPVALAPGGTVAQAASMMSSERVSSLLIASGDGWGIITDRDLRTRVLAAGRPPETPVEEVMTFPARTVSPDAMAAEVLLGMLEGGFHHFPVLDPAGGLVGVVTDTDLMGLGRQSPFALKSAIERSADQETAVAAARRLPETARLLVESRVDPVDVGHVVGLTIDALTARLIELAIERLGSPPVPWAWLALGSEARHEQALATDQDHAIAYDPGGAPEEALDPYFKSLAESVTAGLEAAGIPRCQGDAMAVHPALRRSVAGWKEQLRKWMSDPGMEGSIFTSIAFDYRRVAGPLDVESPLNDVMREVPTRYPQFLRHLARRALDRHPPTGFFRDLVVEAHGEHQGRLDIKHGGIQILTSLARAWALREGRTEKRTLDRLRGAVETGQIEEETRLALEEAFRLLWEIRLEHQAQRITEGVEPDDFVDPASLGLITRRGLKEAFAIIRREQRGLAADLGVT